MLPHHDVHQRIHHACNPQTPTARRRRNIEKYQPSLPGNSNAPGSHTSKAHPPHKTYPYLCAACLLPGPTQFGARTSPTSPSHAVLSTWWPSSTGTRGGFSVGESATAWRRRFTLTACKAHCACTASQASSTATKGRSSPARDFAVYCGAKTLPSAWTGEAERLTTYLLNACGAHQARRRIPQRVRCDR